MIKRTPGVRNFLVASCSFFLLSLFVFNFATPPVNGLEGEPATQFVLNGLKSVHVTVGSMKDLSLDRAGIRSDIEARFEQSGMKIIGEREYLNYSDVDQFYVKVKPLKKRGKVFYSIIVGLSQMEFLEDRADRKIAVTTWQDDVVGFVDEKQEGEIKQKIMQQVDGFIDLWQRANGNERKK